MRKLFLLKVIPILTLFTCFNLESRQYNVDYLMNLIEMGNEEGVKHFFSQPRYVTKLNDIVEFTEIFRSKLEERFGYKPSYREAYDFFKSNINNMELPKEQKDQVIGIYKEIVKQSEKAEEKGYKLSSVTLDFKGDSNFNNDIDIPDELVIAYNEALAGCLLCIIPSPISYGIGGTMIGDAFRRTYDYLEEKSLKKNMMIIIQYDT